MLNHLNKASECTVLITGANRGIGFELAKQYASEGWKVIATCRFPEKFEELASYSDKINLFKLDTTDSKDIAVLAEKLKDCKVDILINNAAAQGPKGLCASFGELDVKAWLDLFHVNTIGPMKLTEALIENVRHGDRKLIVFISSRGGSIGERGILPHHKPGGSYLYRSSKAALNAAAKSLAFDLKDEGISVLLLHPGWVRTDAGGPYADLDTSYSVSCIRKVIDSFSSLETGSFLNYDGAKIPW